MHKKILHVTLVYTLLAGLADTLTGIGLILMPAFTLKLMGIDPVHHQLPLVRFIGAFVAATGSLYLLGLSKRSLPAFWNRLESIWAATAWIRTWVAAVTTWMILTGDLSLSWVAVPLTDSILATFQFIWIKTGRFNGDDC